MGAKKALVYIGGPKQLKDFIWYYLAYGQEYDWTMLCQPMFPEMKLKEICEKTGIFEDVIEVDSYWGKSYISLAIDSLKMIAYWVIGKNKLYAKKEVSKMVDIEKFDLVVVSTTRGVTPGLITCNSDKQKVEILEDGLGDFVDPNAKFHISHIFESSYLIAYMFAKMNYFNYEAKFPLPSTKNCYRYSEQPEKVGATLYKGVRKLNDLQLVDQKEYDSLVEKTFGTPKIIEEVDAVFFTTGLVSYTSEEGANKLNSRIVKYLQKELFGKKLAIKKHPRDTYDYDISGVEVILIDAMIPGEDLFRYITDQQVYFTHPSSIAYKLFERKRMCNIFHCEELKSDKVQRTKQFEYEIDFSKKVKDYGENRKYVNLIEL